MAGHPSSFRRLHWWRIVFLSILFWAALWGSFLSISTPVESVPQGVLAQSQALPPLQSHPLPPSLIDWHTDPAQGDYFTAVRPAEVGYLVWSRFPVTVFVEPPIASEGDRAQVWFDAVNRAMQEWNTYLPLTASAIAETADITIWRRSPSLRIEADRSVRARSAETRYQLYIDCRVSPPVLHQRFTILLRPSQTAIHLQAAARHELGHALGIWGHSPLDSDALYFSQVRTPPPISVRDVNTLKRVYEQPTRLGWPLEAD